MYEAVQVDEMRWNAPRLSHDVAKLLEPFMHMASFLLPPFYQTRFVIAHTITSFQNISNYVLHIKCQHYTRRLQLDIYCTDHN